MQVASLVRLPVAPDALKFDGETDTRTITFVAEAAQLAGPSRLYLTLETAVSVAPEWSQLAIVLNGAPLGTATLKSGEPYSTMFEVPADLLTPGYNALTFTVDQAHRVDCSVNATYELWTRIDPSLSGFAFSTAAAATPDYLSLRTAVRAAEGVTPLRGLIGSALDDENDWILSVMQTLAIGASIDRPMVDFAPRPGDGPGIDVVVGSMPDVMGRIGESSLGISVSPGLNLGRRADGRMVVAIVATTPETFAEALGQLSDGLRETRVGSAPGLAALERLRGPLVEANGRISFDQLGVDSRAFGGRLFNQTVQFRLPADFYPADYAQAEIDLDALYAAGLAPGAALQFKINDQIVSTTNLGGSRSRPEEGRRLPIALAAFRPGQNTLEVEARLPAAIDATCAPGSTADNGRRLQLLGTSTLVLPTMARIGRFPDLGSLDYSIVGRTPRDGLVLVTPRGSLAELGSAATFLTRLAYASGRLIETEISNAADTDGRAALIASPLRDLPNDISRRLAIDLAAEPVGLAAAQMIDIGSGQQPEGMLPRLPSLDGLSASAAALLDDVRAAFYGLGLTVGVRVDALRTDPVPMRPMAGADLVIGQVLNSDGSAPITVLTAPTEQALVAATGKLVEEDTWSRLAGAAVAINAEGGVLTVAPARAAQYYPSTDASFGNMRLAIAGWMSRTPSIFVLLVLSAAILLGLATSWFLKRTRGAR